MAKAELGIILQDLRGKAGNAVFQGSRDGLVVRPRVHGTNPNTPAQQAVRAALTKSAQTFRSLTATQVAAWANFAQTITKHNSVTGRAYNPTPVNAFTELACKFLLVDPDGTVPVDPPTGPFSGDTISVTASASTGTVTFTASAANATDVTTEFLLQPLSGPNRKPSKKNYRVKGYFHFVTGTLTHAVTVPAGYYAAAYRFINSATGQAAPIVSLPVQEVTLSMAAMDKQKKAA